MMHTLHWSFYESYVKSCYDLVSVHQVQMDTICGAGAHVPGGSSGSPEAWCASQYQFSFAPPFPGFDQV